MQQFCLAVVDHIIAGYRPSSIKNFIYFILRLQQPTSTQALIGGNQIGGSE